MKQETGHTQRGRCRTIAEVWAAGTQQGLGGLRLGEEAEAVELVTEEPPPPRGLKGQRGADSRPWRQKGPPYTGHCDHPQISLRGQLPGCCLAKVTPLPGTAHIL